MARDTGSNREELVVELDAEGADPHVVVVHGEIDAYNGHLLRDAIARALATSPKEVVVDLAGVPFMDSSGLGVLVGGLKAAARSGSRLVARDPQQRVAALIRLTGLQKLLLGR